MSDIIERLRKTASRGVSVWGDLQMEAADEIETLRGRLALPAPAPGIELEVEDLSKLVDRLGGILSRTAIALRGPEPPLTRWSWHDLPELVDALKDEIAVLRLRPHAAQPAPAPEELSPEFTDTARSALLWVLWHHQGASSAVGQPIRFALGMGAHDRLNEHQIAEAKRWAATTGSTTAEFHKVPAAPAVSAVWTPEELDAAKQRAKDTAAWLLQNAPAAPAVPDPWKSAVLDRLAATCMDAQQDEPPASILRRIIDWEVTVALDPAVSDIAPYLCIKPACGPDCSGCNCAISPQDMRDYAVRYAILRNAPIDAIRDGGVFAGKTPDNVVINGEHLDAAVDALRGITGDSK